MKITFTLAADIGDGEPVWVSDSLFSSCLTPGVERGAFEVYTQYMSTPMRYFQTGIPYHIYNRGNRKCEIFLDYKDYQRFMRKLLEYAKKYELQLLSYCLMPTHFHLLVLPQSETAITKLMLSLCTSYSKYFNIRHALVGRLFQERFRAKIVETDEYLLHLSRYIHLNPVAEELERLTFVFQSASLTPGVEHALRDLHSYPWSSYPSYIDREVGICNKKIILDYFSSSRRDNSYQKFVESGISKEERVIILPFL